jgi:hypothetical protein
MPKSLYCIYAFPFLAMHVVMMDLFESWGLIIKRIMLHILFMFITFVTLNKILTICFHNPFRDYTTISHYNLVNVYLQLFIGSISFLFIFLIRCLKFLMSIPIAQIIVFLHFVMCHTCINNFFTLCLHIYTCMVCRYKSWKYLSLCLPYEQGKCLSFAFTFIWIHNFAKPIYIDHYPIWKFCETFCLYIYNNIFEICV